MKPPAAFLAATLCLPCAAVMAATDPTPHGRSAVLAAIDTDTDGTVTLDEAKTAATRKFAALDTDRDGKLDPSELTGIIGKKGLAAADGDKDAVLDKTEYLTLVAATFKKADVDKDGVLNAADLNTEPGRQLVGLLAY